MDCVSKIGPSLLRVFSEQVLRSDSDISESEEVRNAALRYLKMSFFEMKVQRKSLWTAPLGVLHINLFSEHISFCISQYHMDT